MPTLNEMRLKNGAIFGDEDTAEYVYMPAAEIGAARPVCVYEQGDSRADVSFVEALRLIRVRSLRPTTHPRLGASSC